MKKNILILLLAVIFASLQTTVLKEVKLFGATPNLLLSLIVAVSMFRGVAGGGLTGLLCGLLADNMGYGPFGFYSFFYMTAGAFLGFSSDRYFNKNILFQITLTFITDMFISLLYFFFMFIIWGRGGHMIVGFSKVFAQGVYTAVFSIIVYMTVKKIFIKEMKNEY